MSMALPALNAVPGSSPTLLHTMQRTQRIVRSQAEMHHPLVQDRAPRSWMPWTSALCTSASLGLMGTARKAKARMNATGFDPTNSIGVLEPLGYWDPMGLMKVADENDYYGENWKSEETFNWYRAAELKHGRLAMVALTGTIAAAFTRFPLEECKMSSDGLNAINGEAAGGIGIFFLGAAYIESQVPSGDFKDPLGVGESDPDYCYGVDMQNKEIAHGRLAMSTMFTLWLYDFFDGSAPSALMKSPSPAYLIGILGMLLVWSQNLGNQVDDYKLQALPAPKVAGALPDRS